MGHNIIKQYSWEDFLFFILKIFDEIACILCGQIHKVKVHQYFLRLVRSEVTEGNLRIIIFSIFCRYAKATGKQYTKRILPYFVIPECNICLINVFKFYQISMTTGKIRYDIANNIMGTICIQTINRHYGMVTQYLSQTILTTASYKAVIPNLTGLESFIPTGRNPLEELCHQAGQVDLAVRKAGLPVSTDINPIRMVHRIYVLQKSRGPVHLPMNLRICCLLFYDTS